jgi:hypothetical protein
MPITASFGICDFPCTFVVADEVNKGKLDVNIETTEEAGDWTFHTQVSWLS